MLRGAAKNFAHVAPVCRPADYEPVLTELRAAGELSHETRRRLAATAFATRRPTRRRSRPGSPAASVPPSSSRRCSRSTRPRLRREPAPARGLLRRGGVRTHLLSRVEQLHAASSRSTTSTTSTRRAARARVRAARLRDREARESVRRRRRRDDRGGVRGRARGRPALGLRRRRRPQPCRQRRARRAPPEQFVEVLLRAGLRRGRARGAVRKSRSVSSATPSGARGRVGSATTSASSAACSCRTATGTSRTARGWRPRRGRADGGQWGDLLFAARV